ncbi:hypothetical protein [Paenibacillus sp. FSL H8-0034]|uniref:hypothetical protein n=1 Tax=Paenibacillus sp. FSL H8-0034 TaxID=2954671 RepID=UPI0030F53552
MNNETGKRAITKDKQPTLIVGGTGKTDRRVDERLKLGLPARIGSRSGDPVFNGENPHTTASSGPWEGHPWVLPTTLEMQAATGVWGGSR